MDKDYKFTIDTTYLDKYNLTKGDIILILANIWNVDIEEAQHSMFSRKMGTIDCGIFMPSKASIKAFCDMTVDSIDNITIPEEQLLDCAKRMKAVYPKGINTSVNQFWTEGPQLIVKRLKVFIKKYGEFPVDDIVDATERYVKNNENNPFMRTLKYFIFKETKDSEGNPDSVSDLYNYLINKDDESLNENWNVRVY